ncbi:MAG: diguanylate cyclase [Syntrophobacteraceae bacterium]|nr:diguanylate cyclase [Desulfobacteraceae bacterium]
MSDVNRNKLGILIVDDTPRNIQVVAGILNREGYSLFFATDGRKALELAGKRTFDLVLMDVMMPGLDGFETCAQLKRMPGYTDVPVIFLTAKTEPGSILKGFEVGGVDYVTKPFHSSELLSRVKAHLGIRALTKELQETNKVLEHRMDIVDRFVMMLSVNREGVITYASRAFCRAVDCDREELVGKNLRDPAHSDGQCRIIEDIYELVLKNGRFDGEIRSRTPNGTEHWFGVNVFYFAEDIKATEYKIIMEDITNRKIVEKQSITDDLTGLYNRRHFSRVFPEEIGRARRDSKILAFAMLDVDHFKLYNDTYGHVKGDEVLVGVAKALETVMKRSGDHCFRLGGEEFGAAYMSNSTENALAMAEKLRQAVEDLRIEHKENEAGPFVTISVGVHLVDFSTAPAFDEDSEAWYRNADKALYSAKHGGRNRVSIYCPEEILDSGGPSAPAELPADFGAFPGRQPTPGYHES